MHSCLICSNEITPFMSFGKMPLANGFLKPGFKGVEHVFELKVGFCSGCRMMQLVNVTDRSQMFHEDYPFFTSTSSRMVQHFKELADEVMAQRIGAPDPFVVEIGSNEGALLKRFARAGIRNVGVDPSENVAQVAREQGITTITGFFETDIAGQLIKSHGQADVVLGANVLSHIPGVQSVAEGIKKLLKPNGVFVLEEPYVVKVLENTCFDQIYADHMFYFSLTAISRLCERNGLELIDASYQDVHGGSIRYCIAHRDALPVSPKVASMCEKEQAFGLQGPAVYERFRDRIEQNRSDLISLLKELKAQGKRVVGYGATAKSSTVINYCGITTDLIEFISDNTPIKQGKLSPLARIPVKSHEAFKRHYPDYALLFAWNHAEEILSKEAAFHRSGGKWIFYMPQVRVVSGPGEAEMGVGKGTEEDKGVTHV